MNLTKQPLAKDDPPPVSREKAAEAFAAELLREIESEWAGAVEQIRPALEAAHASGARQALLQVEVSSEGLINSVNTIAQEYAKERAAELVGMRYTEDGELVPNPNAQWAISDTTRERIREIVTEAFGRDTPIAEMKQAILEALRAETEGGGIFSEERAQMISRTEISRSQNAGNYLGFQKSGVVTHVKWLVSNLTPCDECLQNQDVEVEIGKPFPTGDLHPPNHPNCACVIIPSGFYDKRR